MGDAPTKEKRESGVADNRTVVKQRVRHARDDQSIMKATANRPKPDVEFRRRARTTGADTKGLVPIAKVMDVNTKFETIATKGENPTVKVPKALKMLGMRFLDPSITHCITCSVGFTTTNRRHYCRRCGRIFCDLCTAKRQQLYTGGPMLRVCQPCSAPVLFQLPINLLQVITTYLSTQEMAPVISTCHRFQLSVNLPYEEVRNIHDIYDKQHTKYLQKGAFGCVYATRKQGSRAQSDQAAIKVIDKYHVYSLREWQFIKREIDLHRGIKHPNIVELMKVYQTRSKVYIVMELGKGDLFDYMIDKGFMTESEVCSIAMQLLYALDYLHSVAHVVHRDVKPENILVFGGSTRPMNGVHTFSPMVKLCDFGLAKRFDVTSEPSAVSCTPCGTLSYCPPEVLSKTVSTTTDKLCKLDIFSLGIVLHVLISGNEPFKGKSPQELLRSMKKEMSFSGKEWLGVSEPMRRMVAEMLRFHTPSRPTAQDAIAILAGTPAAPPPFQLAKTNGYGHSSAPYPPALPVCVPTTKSSTKAIPVGIGGRGSPVHPGLSPPTLSLAESMGTLPLMESSLFKERVNASVTQGFEYRLDDEAGGEIKVGQVKKTERVRGKDAEIPVWVFNGFFFPYT